jgi:hypothetical protein
LGIGGDTVPSPYTPIKLLPRDTSSLFGTTTSQAQQQEVELLGKRITIAPSGLPSEILVTQDQAGASPLAAPRSVLASLGAGMSFAVGGLSLDAPQLVVGQATPMAVAWESTSQDHSGGGSVTVTGSLDCTGYVSVNVTVRAHKAIADAGVILQLPANPDTSVFAMGLGRPGGLMNSWVSSTPAQAAMSATWIVLDFNWVVELDGFRLYSAGDKVHDVTKSFLQSATLASVEPGSIVWGKVASHFVTAVGTKLPQAFSFPATKARFWRWVATDVVHAGIAECGSGASSHCQPNVAEIEFHEAGSPKSVWMLNNGTAAKSIDIADSGENDAENNAWQAVDGKLTYENAGPGHAGQGWDAAQVELPYPPVPVKPPPRPGPQNVSWVWDKRNG